MVPSEFERFLHDFAVAVEVAMQDGLADSRSGLSEARVLALESARDTTDRTTTAYRYETAIRVLTERFMGPEEAASISRREGRATAGEPRGAHRAHSRSTARKENTGW
jgi:hypothetical protein